jgi:hypothetical protein
MRARHSKAIGLLLACAAIATIGCGGEPRYVIKGTVVEGGKPVEFEYYEEGGSCVELEFEQVGDYGGSTEIESFSTFAKEDGSFVIDGSDGSGIPAGEYRVSLKKIGDTVNGPDDLWQGAHVGANSQFVYEITADMDNLKIDVASPPSSGSSTPADSES